MNKITFGKTITKELLSKVINQENLILHNIASAEKDQPLYLDIDEVLGHVIIKKFIKNISFLSWFTDLSLIILPKIGDRFNMYYTKWIFLWLIQKDKTDAHVISENLFYILRYFSDVEYFYGSLTNEFCNEVCLKFSIPIAFRLSESRPGVIVMNVRKLDGTSEFEQHNLTFDIILTDKKIIVVTEDNKIQNMFTETYDFISEHSQKDEYVEENANDPENPNVSGIKLSTNINSINQACFDIFTNYFKYKQQLATLNDYKIFLCGYAAVLDIKIRIPCGGKIHYDRTFFYLYDEKLFRDEYPDMTHKNIYLPEEIKMCIQPDKNSVLEEWEKMTFFPGSEYTTYEKSGGGNIKKYIMAKYQYGSLKVNHSHQHH